MPAHPRCFVPGCKTGYPFNRKQLKTEGKKCLNLFCVPRDEEMLAKWKKAIPQADTEFKWTDYICEKHFQEDDIERYYTKRLPDGTSCVLERKVAKLVSKAVPEIFLNSSAHRKSKKKGNHSEVHNKMDTKKEENIQALDIPVSDPPVSEEFHSIINVQSLSFPSNVVITQEEPPCDPIDPEDPIKEESYLSDCIKFVTLPSHFWTIHTTSNNYVVCARWSHQCDAIRRVIIKDDLSITVFVHNFELPKQYDNVTSVSELSLLLKDVDKYVACAGINKFPTICDGIVLPSEYGRSCKWCTNCRKESRRISSQRLCSSLKSKELFHRKRLYHRLVCEQKIYTCLKEEVAEIKKQIEHEKSISRQLSN